MSGGGGKTQQTTQTQKSEPWKAQQPYLKQGFEEAQSQFESTKPGYFEGQTYTDFDPATQQALASQEQRATAGNPLLGQAQSEIGKTLGGDYLDAGNPYMSALSSRISGDVRQGVDSSFSGAGRYGSGLHAQSLSRGIGDALAPIHYQNYQNERQNMQNAAQVAPGLAQQDYYDIGQLANVGSVREGKAGEKLQSDIERFNFGENADRLKLADYMGLIQGNYGGQVQSAQNQPLYRNGLGNALGGASSGASLGMMVGGPWGGAIGGGLGALGGLFG